MPAEKFPARHATKGPLLASHVLMNSALHIAYADDDPDDQQTFVEIMENLPFKAEPVLFTNGLSLFQYLQAAEASGGPPDCIVLDINMPIWDGIKTLQTIRSLAAFDEVPVLMFTTTNSPSEKRRCLELGANGFLTKPTSRLDYPALLGQLTTLITRPTVYRGS